MSGSRCSLWWRSAFIGFIDDYAKVANKRNLGLTARQKFGLQMLVAAVITAVLAVMQSYGAYTTTLNVPFFKQLQPDLLIHSLMGNPFTYPLAFLPVLSVLCVLSWWGRAMPSTSPTVSMGLRSV